MYINFPPPPAGQLPSGLLSHFYRDLNPWQKLQAEKEAKVVAAVWGDGIHSIPCRTTDLTPG